ncbi:alpha/beta fold hydrolase [Aspergillus stella-maris]|uniref:alpha/beta fold hydrolase n=1 Tax=Aspergillus stella-maris TaxID=1810926 RepID=UPI003CCCC446
MPVTTIRVPHLGGIDAAYQTPYPIDKSKPTVVLVNSFTTSSELYRAQFADKSLTDTANLLAIELLGHGQTRTKREHWTYWDTAEMNLQVLESLGIQKAFALGTSQGGWVVVMMALLRPDLIEGILPLGTSLDSESERTRALHCWDGVGLLKPFITFWSVSTPTPHFEPDEDFIGALINSGFNNCSAETAEFWSKTIKANYAGDEGRKRLRMAAINLAERGGLHLRLGDVECPVLWLHGTADVVYSVANAREEIEMFTRSLDANLALVDGGAHFLSCTHPAEVNKALLEFVETYK